MNRRSGLAGVLIVVVAAFAAWWVLSAAVTGASGLHEIDGYWLGPETTCTPADEPSCDAAIQAATQALAAQMSGAAVVRAAVATPSCRSAAYVVCAPRRAGSGTSSSSLISATARATPSASRAWGCSQRTRLQAAGLLTSQPWSLADPRG